jgi:DNA adenine methylase
MKPIIPYKGGKRLLLGAILECFPERYERYIEVFGGSAAVLLGKPKTAFEVYNDIDGDLVNLFLCVKFRPTRLINELRRFCIHSRVGFPLLQRILDGENFYEKYLDDELEALKELDEAGVFMVEKTPEIVEKVKEILVGRVKEFDILRASAYFIQCYGSYAAGRTSIDCNPIKIFMKLNSIIETHNRIQDVFIECKDFEALIGQYDRDEAFFYLDPPYFGTEDSYKAEFKKEDHIRLRDKLKNVSGKWLLSYNDCAEIRELYADFRKIDVSRLNSIAQKFTPGSQYKELLIANYDIEEVRENKAAQYEQIDFFGHLKEAVGEFIEKLAEI